MIIEISTNNY